MVFLEYIFLLTYILLFAVSFAENFNHVPKHIFRDKVAILYFVLYSPLSETLPLPPTTTSMNTIASEDCYSGDTLCLF